MGSVIDESRRVSLIEALLAAAAVVALAAAGCANTPRTPSYRVAVYQSVRAQRAARPARPPSSADLVVHALHDAGLKFGTDGSVGALYGYMRGTHLLIRAPKALPGDILFFDASNGGRAGCANHAAVVEAVDPGGRIAFIESRGGRIQRSYLHPVALARRTTEGQVLNTFLRVKRIEDPSDARYLAGEMLCAVARVRDTVP